jgi:signal transduction histidine kinase
MNNETLLFQTILFSTIAILLCIAVIGIILAITHKHKMEQEMKMNELLLNYEQELRKAEMEVSEVVMKHIAREVHDDITMMFTSANFFLNQVMADSPEKASELSVVSESLSTGIEQLRSFSRSMNKDFILKKSLTEMIEIEAGRLKTLGKFQVHTIYDLGELQISKNQELMAFRIFQEVVQNIMKHAEARNIYITLSSVKGFQLTISDDGIGFDMNNTFNKNGIRNIQERTQLAELNCEYISAPSQGCKVIIEKK